MTNTELRELIRKLRADASVWGTTQAPLYAEAATALQSYAARVEELEARVRVLRDELHSVIWEAGKTAEPLEGFPVEGREKYSIFNYGRDCATTAIEEAVLALLKQLPGEGS